MKNPALKRRPLRLAVFVLCCAPLAHADDYRVVLKSALMHEDYVDGEEQESKLEVSKDGKTAVYSFMMGAKLMSDQAPKGYVLLDVPSDLSGVAVADDLVRVSLKDGAVAHLADRVVWVLEGSPFQEKLIIGVMNDRAWLAPGKIVRKLFSLRLKDDGTVDSLRVVTQGGWLPSSLDEEMEGNEAGWKRIEKRWAAMIQYDGRSLRYRQKPSGPFKTFTP